MGIGDFVGQRGKAGQGSLLPATRLFHYWFGGGGGGGPMGAGGGWADSEAGCGREDYSRAHRD